MKLKEIIDILKEYNKIFGNINCTIGDIECVNKVHNIDNLSCDSNIIVIHPNKESFIE